MPLTRDEIRVVQLLELNFSYIWRFPIQWNFLLYTLPLFSSSCSYNFAIFVSASFALSSLISASYIYWFQLQSQQDQIVMFSMGAVACTLLSVLISCVVIVNQRFTMFKRNIQHVTDMIYSGEKLQ